MKSKLILIAGVIALVFSSASLPAQTGAGTRFAQAGIVTYGTNSLDTGYGVAGKFNLPVSKYIDLQVAGATVIFEPEFETITESTCQGGITFHGDFEGVRPFLTLEAGIAVITYEFGTTEVTEDSALYTGTAGFECPIGDRFSITPLASYEIYYEVPGGDWYYGAEASVKFTNLFSMVGDVLLGGSDDDVIVTVSARFSF